MRIRRTSAGHECASDSRITLTRVTDARFAGSRRRTGWLVRVDLGDCQQHPQHLAKTLAEAAAWERNYWDPDFLHEMRRALPASLAYLHRQAIDDGDPLAYSAMLDAAQEAGAQVRRGFLTFLARAEGLLPAGLPETEDERREGRENAARHANLVIVREARIAHEKNFSSRRGTRTYGRERLMIQYYYNPFSDPAMLPRMLGLIDARLEKMGVERLAEAQHPPGGEDAGDTVARANYPVDGDNIDQVQAVMVGAVSEVVLDAIRSSEGIADAAV